MMGLDLFLFLFSFLRPLNCTLICVFLPAPLYRFVLFYTIYDTIFGATCKYIGFRLASISFELLTGKRIRCVVATVCDVSPSSSRI